LEVKMMSGCTPAVPSHVDVVGVQGGGAALDVRSPVTILISDVF
jgi:hypothetical protein